MASFNKVILMGNLTRDPELKTLPSGTTLTNFGIAVNRRYRTSAGEDREDVCFVDVEVFGRQAETSAQYLRKGAPALIDGRLRMDQWEDRDSGQRRSRLLVNAERVQFLGSPQNSQFQQNGYTPAAGPYQQQSQQPQQQQYYGGNQQQQQPQGSYQNNQFNAAPAPASAPTPTPTPAPTPAPALAPQNQNFTGGNQPQQNQPPQQAMPPSPFEDDDDLTDDIPF